MASPETVALDIQPFDYAGVLKNANNINLGQLQVQDAQRTQSALDTYNQTGDLGALKATPDLYQKSLAIQQSQFNLQQAQEAQNRTENARAAQYVASIPEGTPERTTAWQQELDDGLKKGRVPALVHQQLSSMPPTTDLLNKIIQQGAPIQPVTHGIIREDELMGTKDYGFIDPNAKTVTSSGAAPAAGDDSGSQRMGSLLRSGLTGEPLLAAVEKGYGPALPNYVRAILKGDEPIPSANSRAPLARSALLLVNAVDKDFNQAVWTQRNQYAKEFASTKKGTVGGNLQGLDMFAGHIDKLQQAAADLDNYNIPLGTPARRFIGNPIAGVMSGVSDYDARRAKFDFVRKAALDEAANIYAGTNSALADRESWESKVDPASSGNALKAGTNEVVTLAFDRVKAIAKQYNEVNNTNKSPLDPKFMSPATASMFRRVLGDEAVGLAPPGFKTDHGPLPQQGQGAAQGQGQPQIPPAAVGLLNQIKGGAQSVTLPSGRVLSARDYAAFFNQKYGDGKAEQFMTPR